MTPVVRTAPRDSPEDAVRLASDLYGIDAAAEPLPGERDRNFRLRSPAGDFVLKIANPADSLAVLEMQNAALACLQRSGSELAWPQCVPSLAGRAIEQCGERSIRLLTWVDGVCFTEIRPHTSELLASLGRALARMDLALAGFDHPAAHRVFYWDLKQAAMARQHVPLLPPERRPLVERVFDRWERIDWRGLPHSIVHADPNDYNVLVDPGGRRVASIIDFGDMVYTATVCNLAVALAYAMLDEQDPIAAAARVLTSYHAARPLIPEELAALFPLAAARLAMSVCYCAWQAAEEPGNDYLRISNRPAWALLDRLAALPPGWPEEVFRRACAPPGTRSAAALLASRGRHLGPSLSLSYRQPLHIIRGQGQYLYDAGGQAYLDCVNNVAHVGHSHPRVVQAAAAQMALLNTNTRYLHEHLLEYVERLTATLPEPLRVAYLVCSGSEANELALRLARAHTGRDSVIVVESAYHGNTNALIDLSPYKFDGPGGRGRPEHVAVVPVPDVYRGPHRGADAGVRYASYVAEAAAAAPPAAFFCESALSCAGQVILPPGYLAVAFDAVRAAGGVSVADEVQTGFGRAGTHFWMFETQGAVPDIVTLGKPIGNGHPMGAVITTSEIAASFANGMEYFNTFGGNPVSCAIGLAVLDVIRDERLQENALDSGEHLMRGLRDLAARHELIGDVRGQGLFLGFELVRNRETRDPASAEAEDLVNRMKDLGVLLSTDGPAHNVIKIKPPLVFGRADADLLIERLDTVLP